MPTLTISLDKKELTELLDTFAYDWVEVLGFIGNVAAAFGVEFDEDAVERLMIEKYGDVNE